MSSSEIIIINGKKSASASQKKRKWDEKNEKKIVKLNCVLFICSFVCFVFLQAHTACVGGFSQLRASSLSWCLCYFQFSTKKTSSDFSVLAMQQWRKITPYTPITVITEIAVISNQVPQLLPVLRIML